MKGLESSATFVYRVCCFSCASFSSAKNNSIFFCAFTNSCISSRALRYLVFTWIYREAATNFSREPENRVQKVLYGASLAGNLILLAGTENSANGISWLILVIGSK